MNKQFAHFALVAFCALLASFAWAAALGYLFFMLDSRALTDWLVLAIFTGFVPLYLAVEALHLAGKLKAPRVSRALHDAILNARPSAGSEQIAKRMHYQRSEGFVEVLNEQEIFAAWQKRAPTYLKHHGGNDGQK